MNASADAVGWDHLARVLRGGARSYPQEFSETGSEVLLIEAGWPAPVIDDLRAIAQPPIVVREDSTPGFWSFVLDLSSLNRAFANAEQPPPGGR
jgi:hypothetical protein